MKRSPARASGESHHDAAARLVREALDQSRLKHSAWATSALSGLGLKALSYANRWLIGEQPIPLAAILATTESHPEVTEHVARNLAALVGKVLADAPEAASILADFSAFASLGSSAGCVLASIGKALEDGHIDRAEAIDAMGALDALIEKATSYRERLAVVAREGVDGVRGLEVVNGGKRP